MTELQDKLKKIKHLSEKADAVLIGSSDPTFAYFTGMKLDGSIFYYDFSKAKILTNEMEYSRAKTESRLRATNRGSTIRAEVVRKEDIYKLLKEKTTGLHLGKMNTLTYLEMRRKTKVADITKDIEKARATKTRDEIKKITEACRISGEIFRQAKKKGTEQEIKAEFDRLTSKKGKEPAFPTIVATGTNVKYPHHISSGAKGRPLLIDFGIFNKHYCSDVTRTAGSKYEGIVMRAIEKVEEACALGAKAAELDALARKELGAEAKYFITSLGHGIGVEVHERPFIGPKSKDAMEEGMTFTIEPGIYKAGGLRIENDYLMTKKGAKKLTDF